MCACGKDEGISPCHLGPHVRGIDGAYTVAHLEYDGRILGEHEQQLVKQKVSPVKSSTAGAADGS